MRKTMLLLAMALVMFQTTEAYSQIFGKKRDKIEVASEVRATIFNGLITDIYDFKGQFDKLESIQMEAIALKKTVPDPEFVIIWDQERELYRLAETQQEIGRQSDNLNVFRKKSSEIYASKRTKYN